MTYASELLANVQVVESIPSAPNREICPGYQGIRRAEQGKEQRALQRQIAVRRHKSIVLGAKISSSATRRSVNPCSCTYCAMVSSTGRAAFTP